MLGIVDSGNGGYLVALVERAGLRIRDEVDGTILDGGESMDI